MKLKHFFSIVLFASIIFYSCGNKSNNNDTKNNDNQSYLEDVAKQAGKLCPMDVDTETRWDSVTAPGGNKLKYYYTITVDIPAEFDVNIFNVNMKNMLVNTVKSNALMNVLKNKNVIFVYQYNDKSGNLISEISITPEDYKK